MEIETMLMKALTAYDASRERSLQKEVGVSQIGGCRKQVWLQIQGTPKENETIKLPSLMGTAIHKMIEEAISNGDISGDYELEQEVEWDGLKGHIDLYIPSVGAVVDWKTTKKSSLTYFPSTQQRWQVQLYAYLLEKNGKTPQTVTLVAIPRDGDERHIKTHTEEYNPFVAIEALQWLNEVKAQNEAPAPEKYAAQWCQHFCSYYGTACGGIEGKVDTAEIIEDEKIIFAAEQYLELDRQIKTLTAQKDSAKEVLENVNGSTPSGIQVSWTVVGGRTTIDESEVEKLLGAVPKKTGEPSMRLSVKGIK
jgi:CRISPR/Cas system-associated exonuclease Cas4 (RecB family)